MDVRHNNNALQEINDCIRGLLHLGLNVITFRTLLHLGPNVITFRTLLHLGQLLHLGLQHEWPLCATEGMPTGTEFITETCASVVCKLGMYLRETSQVVSLLSFFLMKIKNKIKILPPQFSP